jgi:GT2 family glycosyltransferase
VPDLTASIIVPTFNRRALLQRLLARLEEAHVGGQPFEVVVAVDGATDGTGEMLEALRTRYPLRILHGENRGPAAARNRAMKAATGEVLIFLDDDVQPVDGMIERHLAIHRRDARAAVIGPMVAPSDAGMPPWLAWEAATIQRQYEMFDSGFFGPTALHFYTGNASVRREPALSAGGFDERFRRVEDVEFAYRLASQGIHFYFAPEAKVVHEPDRTLAGWLRMAHEYGRHAVLLERKGHPYARVIAYQERHFRHPLNRLPPRWCVGHPWRVRSIVAACTALLRYRGPRQNGVHRGACSVMYNVQYWQGFADEMGIGAGWWRQLETEWRVLGESA